MAAVAHIQDSIGLMTLLVIEPPGMIERFLVGLRPIGDAAVDHLAMAHPPGAGHGARHGRMP